MLDKYFDKETKSIVFLGDFNPVIVQPFWLANKKLIREEEANTARVDIIHNEIVKYEFDWVSIEISKTRCSFISTQSPYFGPMKDLAASIFKILRETPIKSVGINHNYDIALRNQKEYYSFGNKLSPLSIWEDKLVDARLLNLEIFDKERFDGLPGIYRIRIIPSDQQIQFGISININDHYDVDQNSLGINMEMVNILEDKWDGSISRSKEIIEQLLSKLEL